MRKFSTLMLGMVALSAAAFAQPASKAEARMTQVSGNRLTLPQLELKIPEITFQEVPFEQVMEYIADFSKMNVVVRWEAVTAAGVSKDKPISLKVKNIRLSQVLWMVMNEAGGTDIKLAYRASGNLLILSTADDLGKEMIVKVYDVADIIQRVQNFQGPSIDVSQQQSSGSGGGGSQNVFSGSQGGNQNQNQNEDNNQQGGAVRPELTQLINLIKSTVEPDSWDANGGKGTIQGFKQTIVVSNTILVHQKLGGPIHEED